MIRAVVCGLVLGSVLSYQAVAQDSTAPVQLAMADRGPHFIYLPDAAHRSAPVDARNAAVFRQALAIDLTDATLPTALAAIERAAGVRIVYKPDILPAQATVSVQATHITLAAALTDVLQDANVDVALSGSNLLTLVPRKGSNNAIGKPLDNRRQQGTGTIAGSVRDSITGGSIQSVTIRVDGTTLEVKTGADGSYKITGVVPGEYRVSARRVGYIAQTRTVVVADGETKTVVFRLNPPATKLDEVVTTALGDQRRYQVGNVISTINVDSIAPTAPVTSVTDLISGRAPGVEVVESTGLLGSGESIRIRGESSLLIQSDPIVIVDGIRVDNSPGGTVNPLANNYSPSPSRINDLDFTQIATIDILKGPAATTEYGTDAANGVIVITTKRGAVGSPKWHVSAQQAASVVPTGFPEYYYSYGHLANGTGAATSCALTTEYVVPPYNDGAIGGGCVADSVTHFNPLNHAKTTMYGTGPSGKYDIDVSGGSESVRYYLSAGLSNATGGVHLPDVFMPEAVALAIPASDLKPNGLEQRSAKANTNITLGPTADEQLNVTYTSTYQESPTSGSLGYGPTVGPVVDDSAHDYGYGAQYNFANSPLSQLASIANQQTDAITAGSSTNWRPTSWFVAHATLGLQHETQQSQETELPQTFAVGFGFNNYGELSYVENANDAYTVDLRGSATASLLRDVKSITSVGLQIVDSRSQQVSASAYGLPVGDLTLVGASSGGPYGNESAARSATVGGYVEEQLAFHDRLFITGALRVDAGSGFGNSYNTTTYPKGSVSWLAYDNGETTFRLRGALGGAGKQPPAGESLQTYNLGNVYFNGNVVPGLLLGSPGTPNLQPEKEIEYEGGFDLALWRNRLTVEFTGYSKTTQNAIYPVPQGFDLGGATQYENLGEVRNSGLEGTVTGTFIQTRALEWNVTLNASTNANKLVHLAPGIQTTKEGVSAGAYQYFSAGYPLYGYWDHTVTYADLNHDGLLEANEVKTDTATTYQGSTLPKEEVSLSTHVGLWRGTVAVGALFDYQGGFKISNWDNWNAGENAIAAAENVIPTPLLQQAYPYGGSLFYQPGDFFRFRELNLTYALPLNWARSLRLSNLSITGAVRNLALWTRFDGDPEAAATVFSDQYQPSSNTTVINNDLRVNFGNVPLMRSWTVRLNVGF